MDKQKLYLEALSLTYFVIITGLVAYNEQRITVYMSLFIIGYFGLTVLIRPRKKYFDVVGIGLFIIFIYILVVNSLNYPF